MEDELVDNSDDVKRLSKADVRADKKLKSAAQRGSKNATKKPGPRKHFSGSRFPGYLSAATVAGCQPPASTYLLSYGYGALQAGTCARRDKSHCFWPWAIF